MKTKLQLLTFFLLIGNLFAAPLHRQILFSLDFAKGTPEEKAFIDKTNELAKMPTVKQFVWLKLEDNKKFTHGLTIVFEDKAGLDAYVNTPEHRSVIKEVWKGVAKDPQVTDYTESGDPAASK